MGIYLWTDNETHNLPSEYQEVEYIDSIGSGTSGPYINTGYSWTTNNGEVKFKYRPLAFGSAYYTARFGGAYMNNNRAFTLYTCYSSPYIGLGGNDIQLTGNTFSVGTDYEIDIAANFGNAYISINGVNSVGTYSGSIGNNYAYSIFAGHENDVFLYRCSARLYYFKMYEGTLVRDFVPCYRKSDNEIGLYDLVNNQFYANAGTGTFTKGPDIPAEVQNELKNAYIGELLPASITLDKNSISLTTVGQTEQLTATVEPEDAPRKTVTWSSDDTSTATVSSSGLVTCVTPGECTITATTVNGLTASCSVENNQGWQPTVNTLWYINMNQSDAVFTDTQGHTVTNNGIVYNASGVSGGCGYNNSDGKRLYSDFNIGESFPSQFTIMCFMKPTGTHYTNDHPMGISIANASTKVTWGIGFNQSNSQVQFNYLRENIAWNTSNYRYSPLNAWHHYALTYNGATMLGYIDGVQVISRTVTGNGSGTGPSGGLTVFGRNHPSYTNTIQGYVDEAICENKVWTAQEIQDYLALYSY